MRVKETEQGPIWPILVSLGVYLAVMALFWAGLGRGDAPQYIHAARDLLEFGPHVGESHWSLRYPLVLSIMASFLVLGGGEFAAALPIFVSGGALVVVSHVFARRLIGGRAGFMLALMVATSPFLVIDPLALSVQAVEQVFLVAALWVFLAEQARDDPRPGRLALAGALCWMAWASRESAAFLPPVILIAALLGPRAGRLRRAVIPAAAFWAGLLAELAFYRIAAGDWFYRMRVDLGHSTAPDTQIFAEVRGGDWINLVAEPLRALVLTPTVAPFVAAAALALISGRARGPAPRLFALAGGAGFAFNAGALSLETQGYSPLFLYASLVVTADALARLGPRTGGALVAGVAALSLALADLRDDQDFFAPRALAALRAAEPVATDSDTAWWARALRRADGASAAEAERAFVDFGATPSDTPVFLTGILRRHGVSPAVDWREVIRIPAPAPSLTRRAVLALVPPDGRIARRLSPLTDAVLYRRDVRE